MERFRGRLAVITGAGDGMGRALAEQLAEAGCDLALVDLFEDKVAETAQRCAVLNPTAAISKHRCDVGIESQIIAMRDEVLAAHDTERINLLFNNAGIGGAGSLFDDPRESWDRTFAVCWGGVYWSTRAFLDALVAADEAHIVNTSSINGFWASLGPDTPHTAYSAAKFAVKGFTEALITDLRLHAPHVGVSVVMPGHIGTGIAANSALAHGMEIDPEISERAAMFRNLAPMTADEAATIILAGVTERRWRILVGDDAHAVDVAVRDAPEDAYEPNFRDRLGNHLQPLIGNPE